MAREDPAYCAWLLRQPCVFCGGPRPTEIHHHTAGSTVAPGARPTGKQLGGKRGKSQRAHDHFGMPAHLRCHAKFHTECEESGDDRRAFQDAEVARLRREYEEEQALKGEPLPTRDEAGKELGVDILAGGSTDPRELAATLASVHQLSPQAEHDVERVIRHAQKGAR